MIDRSQWEEIRNETCKALQSIKGVNEELSLFDMNDVLFHPRLYINKPSNEITDDDLRAVVTNKLLTNRLYHVYFPLYNVYNLHSSTL